MRRSTLAVSLVTLSVSAFAGCSGSNHAGLEMAPESVLPASVARAPAQVREAYRFAIANQEVLSSFPCYCGCGSAGHTSNLQCYVKQVRADGSIEFDTHAFG
jgi:hypothetical protein